MYSDTQLADFMPWAIAEYLGCASRVPATMSEELVWSRTHPTVQPRICMLSDYLYHFQDALIGLFEQAAKSPGQPLSLHGTRTASSARA